MSQRDQDKKRDSTQMTAGYKDKTIKDIIQYTVNQSFCEVSTNGETKYAVR